MVDEPQPVLGERERNDRRPGHRHQLWKLTSADTDAGRQVGNRGCFEQRADGDFGMQGGVDRRDQPHGRDAVATEIEEGVVDADEALRVDAQDVGVDADQDFFDRALRGAVRTAAEIRAR